MEEKLLHSWADQIRSTCYRSVGMFDRITWSVAAASMINVTLGVFLLSLNKRNSSDGSALPTDVEQVGLKVKRRPVLIHFSAFF